MRESDGTSGFTLIEVLVALIIFVAGYVVVHQSVSLAWRGAQFAWAEDAAVRLAQSRLAAAGVETKLGEGEQSGETADGFSWTVRTVRYRPPVSDGFSGGISGGFGEGFTGRRGKIAGYWITVTVRWQGGVLRPARSIQLETLRLAAQL
jgi:prepilin-type N-terminal cleavage/methylation domain-containing protein